MKNNFLFSKKFFCRQFGFSMIELLVVMFIIGLISTLSLVSYRSGQRKYVLTGAVQQLVSDIRKAQNMALSGFSASSQYNGCGLYVEKGDFSYLIYGNKNADPNYQPSDSIIETISLPDGVKIKSVSPASDKLHIFFEPPQPITYLNSATTAGVSEIIILELENSSLSKTIRVSTAGLIQVE
ncbi:MAG: prepilin-type N-terminal cleavage/methylation domain-containing protein [Patescibacteria group bacterium]|nr:prepilin-type N-terminal cleavage/methylation domain-containing protein [Patescibacteria group bacterium]